MIILGFFSGTIFNNIWRLIPEFHQLDSIFSVPLYVQIVLLLTIIFIGLLLSKKSWNLWFLPAFSTMLILLMASWYHLNISNSTNSFTINLYPFYKKEVKLDKVATIKIMDHKILVLTKFNATHHIITGSYPFGLNTNQLNETLNSFGNCVDKRDDGRCIEIKFAWP